MDIKGSKSEGFYFIRPNGRTSRLYPSKEEAEKAFAYSARQSKAAKARLVSYHDLYNIVIKSDEIDRSKYDNEDDKGSAFLYIYGDIKDNFGGGFMSSKNYVEYPTRTVYTLIEEAKKSDGARDLLDDIVNYWIANGENQDVIDYIDRHLPKKEST